MALNRIKGQGILLKVIEAFLTLWVKSKCESFKNLKITINQDQSSLINGSISGVKLIANKINFKNLLINNVQLDSGIIKINLNTMSKKITFKEPFNINGKIEMTGESLEKVMLYDHWNWLGNWLCQNLIDTKYIHGLEVNQDILKLKGRNSISSEIQVGTFKISSSSGNIIIFNKNKTKLVTVPMDDSIKIKEAVLINGAINIILSAKISN